MPSASRPRPSSGSVIDASSTSRRRHRGERQAKLRVGMDRARRGIDDGDRLARELDAADQPVERVLHRSGNAARIFRAADQQALTGSDLAAQSLNRRGRRLRVEIGIEQRQPSKAAIERHRHRPRRQPASRLEHRRVRRCRPETARNRQHAHGAC
jgi:hypothetical protein